MIKLFKLIDLFSWLIQYSYLYHVHKLQRFKPSISVQFFLVDAAQAWWTFGDQLKCNTALVFLLPNLSLTVPFLFFGSNVQSHYLLRIGASDTIAQLIQHTINLILLTMLTTMNMDDYLGDEEVQCWHKFSKAWQNTFFTNPFCMFSYICWETFITKCFLQICSYM